MQTSTIVSAAATAADLRMLGKDTVFHGLTFQSRKRDNDKFLVVHDDDWPKFYRVRYKRDVSPVEYAEKAKALGFSRFLVPAALGDDPVFEGCTIIVAPRAFSGAIAIVNTEESLIDGKLVGVTGSAGKTTIKEMFRQVLVGERQEARVQNTGLNSNLLFPVLYYSSRAADYDYSVIEFASGSLSQGQKFGYTPHLDVAIVGPVTEAHISKFGSLENIFQAKSRILDFPRDRDATAVVYGDSQFSDRLIRLAESKGWRNILTYGTSESCDLRLINADVATGLLTCVVLGTEVSFRMDSVAGGGAHMAENALAVIGGVAGLGLDWKQAIPLLEVFASPDGRGSKAKIALPTGGSAFLLDATYNASFSSVVATVEALSAAQRPHSGAKKILVLGDMAELGPESRRLHENLAPLLTQADIDVILTIGPEMERVSSLVGGGSGTIVAHPKRSPVN